MNNDVYSEYAAYDDYPCSNDVPDMSLSELIFAVIFAFGFAAYQFAIDSVLNLFSRNTPR